MKHAALANTSLRPSRLGFGCSGLMARLGRSDSLKLLQVAADQGITHLDVARSYGYGEAEGVVGDLLATRRGTLSVATKVGIVPPRRTPGLAALKSAARKLASLHPRLHRGLRERAAGMVRHGAFDLASVQRSVEASLRALRVEHIDLLLLHDCTHDDLQPGLLEFLSRLREDGKVGQFGLATDRDTIGRALADHSAFAPVIQFASNLWSTPNQIGSPMGTADPPGIIHHSALGAPFSQLADRIAVDSALARRWAGRLDVDVADRDALGGLFIRAALAENPDGVVLFSSKRPDAIIGNAKLACGELLTPEQVAMLRQLILETSGTVVRETAA